MPDFNLPFLNFIEVNDLKILQPVINSSKKILIQTMNPQYLVKQELIIKCLKDLKKKSGEMYGFLEIAFF